MKNFKLIGLFLILILTGVAIGHAVNTTREESPQVTRQVLVDQNQEASFSAWDYLTQAMIYVESRGNDKAIGEDNAVGCLQITPIYVKEANRLAGYDKFTLEDRLDRQKSLEMFEIVQAFHNPGKDIDRAIRLHNPGASSNYSQSIKERLAEIADARIDEFYRFTNYNRLL